MAAILGFGMVALIGWVLFEIGGWWLLVGSFAVLIWLAHRSEVKSKTGAPAVGSVPPVPTPGSTDAVAPSVEIKVAVPIDHERVRRDVEAQRALDAVRLPPPPYPYSAPAPAQVPRKRAPAKPVPRIDPIVLPDRVEFSYQKADGTISHRIVKVNQVDRPGGKFTGFCETSWAVKTFKIDGVLDTVTRHETGEIVPAMDWYQALVPSTKARSKR